MNTEQKDGSPAFPCVTNIGGKSYATQERTSDGFQYALIHNPGMSLRDWFAGMALQGFCSQTDAVGQRTWYMKYATRCAYEMADAMLAERNKTE